MRPPGQALFSSGGGPPTSISRNEPPTCESGEQIFCANSWLTRIFAELRPATLLLAIVNLYSLCGAIVWPPPPPRRVSLEPLRTAPEKLWKLVPPAEESICFLDDDNSSSQTRTSEELRAIACILLVSRLSGCRGFSQRARSNSY